MIKQLILVLLLPVLASAYTLDTGHALYANMKGIYVFDNRADDGDNIAGTGTMVGTTEDADGFDTPITQTFQSWYNDFGSAYTICIWHDGMTLGAWEGIVSLYSVGDGSALAWQRYNLVDVIRIYHTDYYQTLTTLNMADIAGAQMLALSWNTTNNLAYAYDDGVSLGFVENSTDPSTTMSDAALSVGGSCTVTRIYIFDADIGATALLALTADPDSIFESEGASGAQIFSEVEHSPDTAAAERSPLAAGFSPIHFPTDLTWYMPMVRPYQELLVPLGLTDNGSAIDDHPRVFP